MAGAFKSAKTILTANLVVSVAIGGEWLGRKVVRRGCVAWIQLEDSPRVIRRRWAQMAKDGAAEAVRIVAGVPWRLAPENLAATVDALRGTDLIIVDPVIAAVRVSDWASMSEVRASYDLFRLLARETGSVVVVVAHHRKMAGDEGLQVAGSHQAGATVDGIIEVRRAKELSREERRVTFTGRDWPDIDDLIISLDSESLTFVPVGSFHDRKEEVDAEKAENDAPAIAAAVAKWPVRKTTLKETTFKSWDGRRFARALQQALDQALVREYKDNSPDSGRKVLFIAAASGSELPESATSRPEPPDSATTEQESPGVATSESEPPDAAKSGPEAGLYLTITIGSWEEHYILSLPTPNTKTAWMWRLKLFTEDELTELVDWTRR